MAEYTPTLRTLRVAWVASAAPDSTDEVHRLQAEFDRAIAAHDREVAAKALRRYARAAEENPSHRTWAAGDLLRDVEDWATGIERGDV